MSNFWQHIETDKDPTPTDKSELPVSLTCMSLDCGRMLEHLKRSRTDTRRTCKPHTEKPQGESNLWHSWMWGDSTNHCGTHHFLQLLFLPLLPLLILLLAIIIISIWKHKSTKHNMMHNRVRFQGRRIFAHFWENLQLTLTGHMACKKLDHLLHWELP